MKLVHRFPVPDPQRPQLNNTVFLRIQPGRLYIYHRVVGDSPGFFFWSAAPAQHLVLCGLGEAGGKAGFFACFHGLLYTFLRRTAHAAEIVPEVNDVAQICRFFAL